MSHSLIFLYFRQHHTGLIYKLIQAYYIATNSIIQKNYNYVWLQFLETKMNDV